MSENNKLKEFYRAIESEITDRARAVSGSLADFRETSFAELLAEDLDREGMVESPVLCHYEGGRGSGSMKISGYSVPEEDSCLDLLISIYCQTGDDPAVLNAVDIETAFNRVERFLGRAFDGLHKSLDPSGDQYQMATRIHGLKDKIDRVNFILLTNARLAQRRSRTRKDAVYGLRASYEVWDIERYRRLRESGTAAEMLVVDLKDQPAGGLPCTRLSGHPDGMDICVAIFPGTLLSRLYDEHGTHLLELNVRNYLQARGKINKGILETLKTCPEDFMAYNNGITVVADRILYDKLSDGGEGIVALHGMQIVNGGQTTASIHKAGKDEGADLSKVFVQGKVTVVDAKRFSDVIPLISLYSNSQNKVSQSDLSANHAFHVGFERVARHEWTPDQKTMWFYERARGSYQTAKARERTPARIRDFEKRCPPQMKLTKEDLAKFEHAWLGRPHFVSRGGQKNFVLFMRLISERYGQLPDGWKPSVEEYRRYVAKGILYRSIMKLVHADPSITAYQVDVVNYTVALLAEKTARRIDLDSVWRHQRISDAMTTLANDWIRTVYKHLPLKAHAEGRHIQESFKTEGCWDCIRQLPLTIPEAVETELLAAVDGPVAGTPRGAGKKVEVLQPADHNNIARCKELDENAWGKIAAWGLDSGELAEWQRGISRTLAGYAAEGWVRSPTARQAKHGAAMIAHAKERGVFNEN